ncbi:T9SS type A sorting domain-containing protein [Psychroflexus sp. CAK8W]|uniref:T9SS type A sorting domain-containing protein n=1 Tax=Psychroflexus longus TaxID=2873596 RepID=A0ABS7XL71_9FLAO|nr:T9SS type A sorting domain-containing protein [Psychroflexus longus]MBZ9779515.1 T9SS type A sorting domain-containing protein [Psychroflexus longus]
MKKITLLLIAISFCLNSNGQGTETFDNLELSGTSYQDGTFEGQDGSTWTYTQCRGDVEITGQSIMIGRNRSPQAEFFSGSISGGIGELTFNYLQAFGTDVNLNILVNDIVVGNVTSSDEQNIVKNSGTITIDQPGDFVIKFINENNSDGQVVIDDISWTGYTGSATPNISVGSDVSGLFYFEGNFDPTNAEGSFSVQGINLTENITITSPADFEISTTSGGTFSNAISLTENSGEVSSTEVFVRLQSNLSPGNYSGAVIVSSSSVSESVSVYGEVLVASPQLDVQTASISDLNYDLGNGPSQEESFVIEGQFLIDDINVAAPVDFEVSLSSGTGFSNNVTVNQTAGNASSTVYVRLVQGLTEGAYTGNLQVTSPNATQETVELSGNVFGEVTSDMIITGVFDGPLTGGTPKVIEFYVVRDISDLSTFGAGSANNGGGTDGQEFTFPNVTATAGEFIYISSEAPNFNAFFGFDSDYVSTVANNNGDDAIELFQNGQVIDTFGDINTDGTGEAWEYLDGWVYRTNNTGPDGSSFVLGNWTFSGVDENDDDTTQDTATNPWPIGTFSTTLSVNAFDLNSIKLYPNPVSNGILNIETSANDALSIEFFNMLGQRVLTSKNSKNINVSNLNAGVYLVKINQGSSSLTKKVVIK